MAQLQGVIDSLGDHPRSLGQRKSSGISRSGWGVSEHRDVIRAIRRVLMDLHRLQKISLELFSHSLFLESFEGFSWIRACCSAGTWLSRAVCLSCR